jgi:esterase
VLHGLFGRGRNWQAIGRALADRFRVCLVDLPNHGESPSTLPMTYAAMAESVIRLTDVLGAVSVDLVGHSMGGKVAMAVALARPDLVEGLVVVDIAPVDYAHDHLHLIDAMLALPLRELSGRNEADAALADTVPDRALRQFLLQNLATTPEGLVWQIDLRAIRASMRELSGFPATPGTYAGPTLAIVGGASSYVDARGEAALQRRFPRLQVARLAGVGHWPHAERPIDVQSLLSDFLIHPAVAVPG